MKNMKFLLMSVLGLTVAIMLSACSSKNHIEVDTDHHEVLEDAPQFVLKPQSEGYVVGLGSASYKEDVPFQYQREEAMTNARADLSKKILSNFKSDTRALYAQKGTEDITDSRNFSSNTQNISETVMRGSKQLDIWISPETGELFMMVGIAPENIEYPVEETYEIDTMDVASYSSEQTQVIASNDQAPVDAVKFPIPILEDKKQAVTF